MIHPLGPVPGSNRSGIAKKFLPLWFALLGLQGCQHGVSSGQSVELTGTSLSGHVENPKALLLVQAYDHCLETWREVQRARIEATPQRFKTITSYRWAAPWIPVSDPNLACLTQREAQNKPSLALRIIDRQDPKTPLAQVDPEAWDCLAALYADPNQSIETWRSCGTRKQLQVQLDQSCTPLIETIPVSLAGNIQQLTIQAEKDEPDSPPLYFHYKNSLLTGKAQTSHPFEREFRHYLSFDLPSSSVKAPVKAAWISIFSNHETTLCGHREDIGCGYASQDAFEDYALALLPQDLEPHLLREGPQYKDPTRAQAIFSSMDQAAVVGKLRLQRQDVDRWFQIPLAQAALKTINTSPEGGVMRLGGMVTSRGDNAPANLEWIFVDHLIGKSLGPDLVPRLNLLRCAPKAEEDQ